MGSAVAFLLHDAAAIDETSVLRDQELSNGHESSLLCPLSCYHLFMLGHIFHNAPTAAAKHANDNGTTVSFHDTVTIADGTRPVIRISFSVSVHVTDLRLGRV